MVYTKAEIVDQSKGTYQEMDFLRHIMDVQYEDENGAILYNPVFREKLYISFEKLA